MFSNQQILSVCRAILLKFTHQQILNVRKAQLQSYRNICRRILRHLWSALSAQTHSSKCKCEGNEKNY
ncbi:hypothetical protein HMPREF3208_01441 [Gardnerella vaginalis]|uniref:Uncharacterized protein n=1 Tax=Gardnerella vaginalis TaxID=2702 RepID=A0A133NNJ7_GARVA|nr:hypothetical protein HMPREF3208_01441 [Gardnerella vaginalis]